MTNSTRQKPFDCVQWTRNIRDQMHQETKDLTPEQRLHRLTSSRPSDPVLAKMWDSAKPLPSSRWRDHGTHRAEDRDETRVVIEISKDEATGRYTASALAGGIRAQGDSLDEIRANVKEAVARYLDHTAPMARPKYICLRFLHDEVIPT